MTDNALLFPPVPGIQVHASSFLVLGEDKYLVAWFAGSHEGAADSTIHVLRSADGTSTVAPIAPEDGLPHWNPVLAAGPDGAVWLFYKRGTRIDEWTTWICRSQDEGLTWSSSVELVSGDRSGGRGPVRQAPVQHGGLWIAPGSIEVWEPLQWDSFVDISADGGRSWEQVALPLDHEAADGAGCIQPCLVELPGGTLVALARSTAGSVFRSEARDPFHWCPLEPTGLPNNNSGLAAVALAGGRIIVAHNDAAENWGSRSRLVLSTSDDGGRSWQQAHVLEDGAGGLGKNGEGRPIDATVAGVITSGDGEFSYPCLAVVGDELWITYSWQRRSIALVRLSLSSEAGSLSGGVLI